MRKVTEILTTLYALFYRRCAAAGRVRYAPVVGTGMER
jgi:hypothetical protein